MSLNDDDLIKMYRWMVLTRAFEERVCELQRVGRVPELQHASIGQEAVGVGTCYGLRSDDIVVPSLRTRAAFLVKGISPEKVMAAMHGKATGAARGKETSHHMGDVKLNVVAGSGVLGAVLPIAVGTALACKMQNSDRVSLVFFGDGSSNRGDFHEALNLASIYRLAVIFVCENNQFAQSMSIARHMAIANVADRAAGYGMPGVVVDGNDVIAVHEATQKAIARARAGEGPTLLECKTCRWRGHSEKDLVQAYRSKEEVERWKERCPIKRLRERLLADGALSKASLVDVDREAADIVERAVQFAADSPYPAAEEALNNVYTSWEGRWPL